MTEKISGKECQVQSAQSLFSLRFIKWQHRTLAGAEAVGGAAWLGVIGGPCWLGPPRFVFPSG